MEFNSVKDSGKRSEFETGSVRDVNENKGRFDLLPERALINMMEAVKKAIVHPYFLDENISFIYSAAMENALKFKKTSIIDFLLISAFQILQIAEIMELIEEDLLPYSLNDLLAYNDDALRIHFGIVSKNTGPKGTNSIERIKLDFKTGFSCLFERALLRLARHFQNGSKKYGDSNWKKGIPLNRYLDSGLRHLNNFKKGLQDEDHLIAAAWNFLCLAETYEMINSGLLPASLNNLWTDNNQPARDLYHITSKIEEKKNP